MPTELRVHKWDVVRVRVKKSTDKRPESFTPDMDSIRCIGHVGTKKNWEQRRALVQPHRGKTMKQVLAEHMESGSSLAVVEPGRILDVEVTPRSTEDLETLRLKAKMEVAQADLFSLEDRKPLEPIPFDFHLVVQYPDEVEPRKLKIIDWEINQQFRKFRNLYTSPEQKVREHWLNVVLGPDKDPTFFVGNHHRFPHQWMILGIVWPKK